MFSVGLWSKIKNSDSNLIYRKDPLVLELFRRSKCQQCRGSSKHLDWARMRNKECLNCIWEVSKVAMGTQESTLSNHTTGYIDGAARTGTWPGAVLDERRIKCGVHACTDVMTPSESSKSQRGQAKIWKNWPRNNLTNHTNKSLKKYVKKTNKQNKLIWFSQHKL